MLINIKSCKDFLLRFKEVGFANLALMYPIFFPTIKSWGNALSFLMLTFALIHLIGGKEQYFFSRSKTFWFAFIALISPFFLELIVQVFRGPFTWNALDGPSRFLIGGVVFLYLSKHRDINSVVMSFSLGCLISLPVTFLYVLIFDEFYWDGRCATQILCPNALPVFILTISINSFLYINFNYLGNFKRLLLISVLGVPLIYILLKCETRTVWVAFIILILLTTYRVLSKDKSNFRLSLIIIFMCLLISFMFSPIVAERVNLTYTSAESLLIQPNESSSWNTSLGGRVGLVLLDLYLAFRHMPFGLQDGFLPAYESIAKDIPFLTEYVYEMRLNSGSHCEYTAQLSRKGVILGTLNIFFILLFPVYLFARIVRNKCNESNYSFIVLQALITMCICALGVQVFGLKMTSTFWALLLALHLAFIFNTRSPGN